MNVPAIKTDHSFKVLLMGYYGARNLGDEMMLFCLERWLHGQGVENLTVLAASGEEVSQRWGLPAIENVPLLCQWAWYDAWFRGKAIRLMSLIRSHDVLIAGGGDFIRQDRGWRIFTYGIEKQVIAILFRKPVYLVNVGIGRPHSAWARALLWWMLRRCRRIIVRDRSSYQLCVEAGASAQVEYMPDIVLSMPGWLGTKTADAAHFGSDVVVCLRDRTDVYGHFDLHDGRKASLARILDSLIEAHQCRIVFLPFQSCADEDDNRIHRAVLARMRHPECATVLEWSGELAEVVRRVAESRCVIAMRLHAAVLAVALGRPCIPMPYDRKVIEFVSEMQMRPALTPQALDKTEDAIEVVDAFVASGTASRRRPESDWSAVRLFKEPGQK